MATTAVRLLMLGGCAVSVAALLMLGGCAVSVATLLLWRLLRCDY